MAEDKWDSLSMEQKKILPADAANTNTTIEAEWTITSATRILYRSMPRRDKYMALTSTCHVMPGETEKADKYLSRLGMLLGRSNDAPCRPHMRRMSNDRM